MHISDRLDKLESLRGTAEILNDQEIGGDLSIGGALSVTGATTVTGTLRGLTSLIVSGATSLASLSTSEIDLSGGLVVDNLTVLPAVRNLDDMIHQKLLYNKDLYSFLACFFHLDSLRSTYRCDKRCR